MTSHRLRPALCAALVGAALGVAPAALAIDADWPSAQDRPGNAEIWRAIKQGAQGTPSATGGDATLVKPIPGCSDRAVGFTTPVNANIPVVGQPQGSGPGTGAMALLAAVFGAAFGAGAMLARNLGKHTPEA